VTGGRRALGWAAGALLLGGALLSGRALYLRAKGELAYALIRDAWRQTVSGSRAVRPWPWADTVPIARLRVPALGLDRVVLEGASPGVIAFGPARMMNGAAPGEPGNVVLAGHRTTDFRRLEGAARGQEVVLEWMAGGRLRQRRYRVEEVRVVEPSDTRALEQTLDDRLTLVTCFPFGRSPRSPQRFVVRAVAAGPEAAG
jgi:sortase A